MLKKKNKIFIARNTLYWSDEHFCLDAKPCITHQDCYENVSRKILHRIVYRISKAKKNSMSTVTKMTCEDFVKGCCNLIDYFDTEFNRFVIGVKHNSIAPNPQRLTKQEWRVAQFVGIGLAIKEISYKLGISQSSVSNSIARIRKKFRFSSYTELVAFFSPSGLSTKLTQVSIAGEELLIGFFPLIHINHTKRLTQSELIVLEFLLSGLANGDIARHRNVTEHTIANQVQSIYRKLEVTSRKQLVTIMKNTA